MGPYNGLVVLSDDEHVVLLNPSTRKYTLLQPSPFEICPPWFDHYIRGLGFGIDLTMNDYKFVRNNEISSDPSKDPCMRGNKVEVYELNIDAWREEYYEEEKLPSVNWSPCSELFYKGVCHWFASGDGELHAATLAIKRLFGGFSHEDPHEHIRNFVDIFRPFSFKNISQESVWLKLFTFSLMGEARKWLSEKPRASITSWEDIITTFQVRFFPPLKIMILQDNIQSFKRLAASQSMRFGYNLGS
ncbi:uncharacterized protein LOC107021658 [Solanum pennellii]|uniref:Uncharacterized protein LOC107021658 n=1 Tax=Solanum pennellii TaxID=28526 RepID=A0ABM1V187_SOLPN|nr:uncharacterized protein LOC107021658 [Solanum pennellii]